MEALLAGSHVFKDDDLQARAVGLCPSMGENKDKKAEKNEKRDEKVEKADEKVEKVEKADNKKDKTAEKNEQRDEKDWKIKGKKIKKRTKSKKGSKTPHQRSTRAKPAKGKVRASARKQVMQRVQLTPAVLAAIAKSAIIQFLKSSANVLVAESAAELLAVLAPDCLP